MNAFFRKSLLAALALSAGTSALAASTETDYAAAFSKIHQVKAGVLNVGYVDIGPRDGQPIILLHGWPYDIQSYATVAPKLAARGYRVIVPWLRGYGSTRFLSDSTPRNGQPSAMAADVVALMDALNIKQAVFGGFDWGARTADIVAALWPERVKSLVSVSGYLISSQALGKKPLPPKAELQWWYQFYFATERGRQGYAQNTHDFARLIWQQASPGWKFSEATFNQSAKALDNPDQVAITISNYRWRMGLEKGEQMYDAYEKKLAALPVITVPAITIEGDNNGAPHPAPEAY
ncbi:alpha/beta fold hydrolase, partial [Pantoea septica]